MARSLGKLLDLRRILYFIKDKTYLKKATSPSPEIYKELKTKIIAQIENAHVKYRFHKIKDSQDVDFYEGYMKIAEKLKDYM